MTNVFTAMSESALWDAFRQGDDGAFNHIYAHFSTDLFRYGMHLCGSDVLVQDCMHDLFVRIFSRRSTLGETTSIKFYLLRSLRREIAQASQKKTKEAQTSQAIANQYNFSFEQAAENSLVQKEQHNALSKAMLQAVNELPKKQREIVYLIFYCSLSYEQVADTLELTIRTVYNQVYNAVQRLKQAAPVLEPLIA